MIVPRSAQSSASSASGSEGAGTPRGSARSASGSEGAGAPTLAFVTLGCPKNTVDSEHMIALLARDGFRTVGDVGAADVAVVNTCAFLQSAVRESKQAIEQVASLKRDGRLKALVVTGCLAQRAGDSLLDEFPEIDAVLGTGRWKDVVVAARHALDGSAARSANTEYPGGALDSLTPRALSTPRHLAYLKISEGCDHGCTFCIIPQLRGPQRSRTIDDVVAEAERLAAQGVKEVNLIGQDTTGWGTDRDQGQELADLLEALDRVETLTWIRVQYTYPRLWSDRLIEVWANARRVVPYVDMPLQHIAAEPLRRMARGMTAADTRALVRRIKTGIPNVSFRTNFIVGFPGETDEQFAELERYVGEEGFDHLVVFAYEREPESPAYHMTPRVSIQARRHRRARLLALQQRCSRTRLAERIGQRVTVMIDGPAGRGQWAARTAGSAWEVDGGVVVDGGDLTPGACVDVRVTGAAAYDLFARHEPVERDGLRVVA
jgi:ribosomal protein S12 methylthiotransferase